MVDEGHGVERVAAGERHGCLHRLLQQVRSRKRLQDSGGDGLLQNQAFVFCSLWNMELHVELGVAEREQDGSRHV